MKSSICIVFALISIAALAAAPPVQAKKAHAQACPRGWSLIGEVCINDRTGDVALPGDK